MKTQIKLLKAIATIFLFSAFISCGERLKQINHIDKKEFLLKQGYEMMDKYKLQVMVIDGCEYLYAYQGHYAGNILTHKGNCKFCAERSKK